MLDEFFPNTRPYTTLLSIGTAVLRCANPSPCPPCVCPLPGMGASDSKLVFKQGIFKLAERKNLPAHDAYWASVCSHFAVIRAEH